MHDQVREWLEKGEVDVFIGYMMVEGHSLPHIFTKERIDEVDKLIDGPFRYSLEKIALRFVEQKPDLKVGLLSRDCNQRALNVLFVWNQLKSENVKTITLNCCPSIMKEHADCSYLTHDRSGILDYSDGIENQMTIEEVENFDQEERFNRWSYEFAKCIKCYGCRNICPVCFCKDCSLENPDLVGIGDLPAEIPIFHLVRAVHMGGRCIDCGLCEDACPVDIPLRLLYQKVNNIVADVLGYKAGSDSSQSPFNILGEKVTLETRKLNAV